jgi:ABC-type dipeptide/oligopeptide/nickel transport system ATPase component
VGLVGASGTGKSSVASAAFGPLVQGVLPMTIQVHAEDSTVKTEQRSLAAHLARALGRTLTRSGDMSARQRSDLLSQTSPDEKVARNKRTSRRLVSFAVGIPPF